MDFINKEIFVTIIFLMLRKDTSPSHNWFPETFMHEERFVTSYMFSFNWGSKKYFWGNIKNFYFEELISVEDQHTPKQRIK